ncbi:Alpha/beta hydrolase family protein [Microbulbifer aggregans]|uniref:Alpha/beta hydrolase family protein n=1 Tax=Microbulbifer aggregans TaxID=1769779 RepID=A0A1C9W8G2_9GAMM|nr:alpha/beta fold hydrolase [Microbulbifer aggregans]AOS97441.1 Alpha/beta hydrolase family protein [Microbulbifer aggregans]
MRACSIQIGLLLMALFTAGCQYAPTATDAAGKRSSDPRLLKLSYTSEVDNSGREYFVYLPRGYEDRPEREWPVLLHLHGNGERGDGRDELDFTLIHGPLYEAWIQKRDLPFIIVVPQLHMFGMDKTVSYIANRSRDSIPKRLDNGVPERKYIQPRGEMGIGQPISGWDEIPQGLPWGWDKVETDLLNMLDQVDELYRTDNRRIYLTGLSYGGFGSWYMASRHPEKFAAVAPVVGWGHPDLMAPIAENKVPVWVFAGGRDRTVEKSYFYAGVNRLEEMGGEVRFTVHEDMAHDVWRRVYEGEDFYQWLLQHSLEEGQSAP